MQNVELQRADHAEDLLRSQQRVEDLHYAFLGQVVQRAIELLGLHGVFEADSTQQLRREIGDALKLENLALREGVANADRAVIGNADDVTGLRFIGGLALLGKEEDGALTEIKRCSRTLSSSWKTSSRNWW